MVYKIKSKIEKKQFRFILIPSGKYIYMSGRNRKEAHNQLKAKIRKYKKLKFGFYGDKKNKNGI